MKTLPKLLLTLSGLACVVSWMLTRPPGEGSGPDARSEAPPGTQGKSQARSEGRKLPPDLVREKEKTASLTLAAAGETPPTDGHPARMAPALNAGNSGGSEPIPLEIVPPISLAERAKRVEEDANRELERLVPLLHLSEEQQDRVFEKLAQNSIYWSPGLAAGPGAGAGPFTGAGSKAGGAAGAAEGSGTISPTTRSIPDLLSGSGSSGGTEPILTADQEQTMLADDLERREWWGEVISLLQTNIQTGASAADASLPAAAVDAADAAAKGNPATTPVETVVPPTTVEGAEAVVD